MTMQFSLSIIVFGVIKAFISWYDLLVCVLFFSLWEIADTSRSWAQFHVQVYCNGPGLHSVISGLLRWNVDLCSLILPSSQLPPLPPFFFHSQSVRARREERKSTEWCSSILRSIQTWDNGFPFKEAAGWMLSQLLKTKTPKVRGQSGWGWGGK